MKKDAFLPVGVLYDVDMWLWHIYTIDLDNMCRALLQKKGRSDILHCITEKAFSSRCSFMQHLK
jgi:hypothetical protein